MQGLSIVIAIVSAASVLGEIDWDCFPTYRTDEFYPGHQGQCCKLKVVLPDDFDEVYEECERDIPEPAQPRRTNKLTRLPKPEEVRYKMCVSQCLFHGLGLVRNGTLVEDAVGKTITAKDPELFAVVESATANCLKSYEMDIDTSQKCKSGAHELYSCITREIFRKCPASVWTPSQECEFLKAKLSMCPRTIAQIISN